MATYFHDHVGDKPNYSLFQHAAEYAITEVGLNSGLREMVNVLCNYGFSRELSWQRAIRHKFGFIDTSKPGDIMNPAMYYHHSQIIKGLSDKEKLHLMVGKISLNELNKYENYSGQISEKKIKSYYNL